MVVADLETPAANRTSERAATMLTIVSRQAFYFRPPRPVNQPGYVLRQLWRQAAELPEDDLADKLRDRLAQPGSCLVPQWTARRSRRAVSAELGGHVGEV
jgi:hypothetical protein